MIGTRCVSKKSKKIGGKKITGLGHTFSYSKGNSRAVIRFFMHFQEFTLNIDLSLFQATEQRLIHNKEKI